MRCKICHKRFMLDKNHRYDVIKYPEGVLGGLTKNSIIYDAFDCPHCGCQNIVNVREPVRMSLDDIKTEEEE